MRCYGMALVHEEYDQGRLFLKVSSPLLLSVSLSAVLPSFVCPPLHLPISPHPSALITWGDAALMLTPGKKPKSSLYLSALKFLPIFPAHFSQSRNSGHSISHTGAFYLIEHNTPGSSMNIDSPKLCIMGVLRF